MYLAMKIFDITYEMGLAFLKISNNRKLGCLFFILTGLCFITEKKSFLVSVLLFEVIMILIFISESRTILLSLRGFLSSGMLYWFSITGLFILYIWQTTGTDSLWLGYIIIFLSWCFYSLLANNKVASAANQIHSTILALVVIMKDAIIYSIPESFLNEMTASGDTYERIIEMSFGAIFYPFLAINLVALLLCNLKGYWIEKYNHNQDITLYGIDNRCE